MEFLINGLHYLYLFYLFFITSHHFHIILLDYYTTFWIRYAYWSHSYPSCSSSSCVGGATSWKKTYRPIGSVVSNRLGVKFGTNVPRVSNASIDGVGFRVWRHTIKMAAMTSFREKPLPCPPSHWLAVCAIVQYPIRFLRKSTGVYGWVSGVQW